MLSLRPDLLSVLIGINDVGINDASRGAPAAEFEKQYDQLLADTVAAYPHVRLALGEPFGERFNGPVRKRKENREQ